jgi:holo-[acyl-carrier protein] synthase
MGIVGVGIDVCDVDRFAAALRRRPGMVHRLFTPTEAGRPVASQAARFAAKEALAKALGAPSGLSWLDAEVQTDDLGRPSFALTGTVAARAAALGIAHIHLSLSHDAGIASAVVVCES